MKKVYALIVAFMIALGLIIAMDIFTKNIVSENTNLLTYCNTDARNAADDIMEKVITDESIVVLGSSELEAADALAYPPTLFNNGNSDFNMILIGRGGTQSLHHAINVGSLQNNIKNNKIVLIISPQWFVEPNLEPEGFASRFEETVFVEFLQNPNISTETKTRVCNRVNDLLVSWPSQLERAKMYEAMHLNKDNVGVLKKIDLNLYQAFINTKLQYELLPNICKSSRSKMSKDKVIASEINWDELLDLAEQLGSNECTNNEYGIYDEYYDTYIREVYHEQENSNKETYEESQEYADLELFLTVCKETGIEPLIVSVPVNGRWYDYIGFAQEDRQQYYQKIKNICQKYDVELADFSDKEYEMYFLKDVMHLGWKGWVYLDREIYNFYKKS